MSDVAPTLTTSCGSLPPEGALRLRPGEAGSAAPAWEDCPHATHFVWFAAPRGGAAPAARQSRFRGPCLKRCAPRWLFLSGPLAFQLKQRCK
jgi:lipoprotein-releasing system ATP-binding protein